MTIYTPRFAGYAGLRSHTLSGQNSPKREKLAKDWLLKRKIYSHVNSLNELRFEPLDFKNYLRMDEDTYRNLLSMVAPLIQKQDTVMRKSISPHERLAVTLRFLTTGRTYEDLKYTSVISSQALGKISPETCDALYRVLRREYLTFPTTEEEWKDIAQLFEERWNFPHSIGALDGKHINIVPPASEFFNYKGHHSMVLLGLVNANYQFLLVDFGTNGRISDGGVLQNTVMASCALHNFLIVNSATSYAPQNFFYQEDIANGSITTLGYNVENSNMHSLDRRNSGNIANSAKQVRENFMNYFCNEGTVPWQNKFIA